MAVAQKPPPDWELVYKRNPVERLKRDKAPLGIREELPALIAQGYENVAEEDIVLPSSGLPDGRSYPSDQVGSDLPDTKWLHSSWDSRPSADALALTPEQTAWTQEHFVYTVRDPRFAFAQPVLQSDFNSGTVYFDDVRIEPLLGAEANAASARN